MKPIHNLNTMSKYSLLALSILFNSFVFAHSGGATIGADGNASATALAAITCFDDGNGAPAGLFAQIRDLSVPVPGLLVNMQLYKGIQATSITDTITGDAQYSEAVQLNAGPGTYQMMVNKTAFGAKAFDVIWHCVTATNAHTGTDIVIRQFQ